MTPRDGAVEKWTARILRLGTLSAVILISVGLLVAVADGGASPGPRPLAELVESAGPDTLIAVGFVGLAVTPAVAVAASAVALWRAGERRVAVVAAVVVALLAASAVAAASVAAPS